MAIDNEEIYNKYIKPELKTVYMSDEYAAQTLPLALIRPLGLASMQSIGYVTQHAHTGVSSSWKSWDAMQDGLPGMSVWQAELIG